EQYKIKEKLDLKEIKKEFSKVHCPSCKAEMPASSLNLQNKIAKCDSCNVIFSIENEIDSVQKNKEIKEEIFRPEGINLFYFKDEMDITVQQHLQGFDLFGIIVLPFLTAMAVLLYFAKGISFYYPIIFVLGSLYFIYRALNYSKNKSYITINDKFLSIKSRPKNLKKDKMYATDEIDQLYLRQDPSGYFAIHVIINGLDGQKHVKLITVNTLSKAKYLEQEIEKHLQIEERKVPEANF
ncbi:MAG: hypothetical protein KJP00_00590, partial [Bacteroidia bacterium]|nr:hypothetical protein [Bacteroidia bacterium]